MPPSPAAGRVPLRVVLAWCLFDWANSAFPTVIATFVFAAYFARAVAPDEVAGTAAWGMVMSASGLAIALLSPIAGAFADRSGRLKPWLAGFSAACVAATALLWLVRPEPADMLLAMVLVAVANVGFEVGTVFYNAMLPRIAAPAMLGRISGWAWGFGYLGGLACLGVVLVAFVQNPTPPFGLDRAAAEHVRIVGPLVAVWFLAFGWPTLALVPEAPAAAGGRAAGSIGTAVRTGLQALGATLRVLRAGAPEGRFLLAYLFYMDGLNTLFAFGGVYAAGTFGMSVAEIVEFGIALNVTAGLGAFAFGWLDDRVGAKATVAISLVALIGFGIPLLLVTGKGTFWALAMGAGLFMGPTQAASRSMMARLAPEERRAELFGLMALAGKVTAFLGPALVGWATLASGSQRVGMAPIIVLLAVGLAMLLRAPSPNRPTKAGEAPAS